MKTTLTISGAVYADLRNIVLSAAPLEGAAYVLCGHSRHGDELRLVARAVVPVADGDYLLREKYRLSIASRSFVDAAKQARSDGSCILFVHSHPGGEGKHSTQDDREEPALMEFFDDRVENRVHGSAVIGESPEITARLWIGGAWTMVDRVLVFGERFRVLPHPETIEGPLPTFFDRQVRAFGPELQRVLRHLRVGIIGCGGVGSAVAEQVARLGIGGLALFDHDRLSDTNVTRVYGSHMSDIGSNKARLLAEHIKALGLGTDIRVFDRSILDEATAKEMRQCDLLFGCTDKEAPRNILNSFALFYSTPVIDLGVKISSTDGVVDSIAGRITFLMPGSACLFCRGRIDPEAIRLETLPPEERAGLVEEGYAPELSHPDPAVITFTTAVAARAVTELLNRFTGAIHDDMFTEYFLLFDMEKTLRTNIAPSASCMCSQRKNWGRGDTTLFLNQIWSAATPSESRPL